jgi:Na+/H+ antiporter NhaD/arsenite permease-like protein
MLLVRPLIRANDDRKHNAHVMIFFIFLVANIGGSLTPIGDPPLFLGFLEGVHFFWTFQNLWKPTLLMAVALLVVFFCLDAVLYQREGRIKPDPTPDSRIRIEGLHNVALIAVILAAVIFSGSVEWQTVEIMGVMVESQNLLRDAVLLGITGLAFILSSPKVRAANDFSLEPVNEIAKLFGGIFITIIPVLTILKAGQDGALAGVIRMVTTPAGQHDPMMYFWVTGLLSSFLDNAPTYLVFFNAAGGDPHALMGPLAPVLMAISMGAVFMGANSYIGNAPNFMVKSMAEQRGVIMPSFFGYLLWSGGFLLPLFVLTGWLFF